MIHYANLIGALGYILVKELEDVEPIRPVLPFLRELGVEIPRDLERLRSEYADIFIINIPPYESAFTSQANRLWDAAAIEVWGHYKEAGFQPDLAKARALAPDHVGLELLFLSILLERGLRDMADEFLSMHILRWVPQLYAAVELNYPKSFYAKVLKAALDLSIEAYREL
ncbi:putative component of anaerobic dehydrogenase [Pyrobaculum oguniense TE7]|uniref:Component of anaerobic dehydrogenase n=1 Tax=Pyrobaculum oguniense (strain DSM 13380 / JCM 10595 / TE7) TaxID=698757 RepID=H6Q8K2_PYROT|nr:putative component of anaerobic dehydrogenase [Pyrobaculum oguniense TE7]